MKSKKGNLHPGTILCGCGEEVPFAQWTTHKREKHVKA